MLTGISLESESGTFPRFSNGREITFPPFYLGAHLVQCGAAQLSCWRERSPLHVAYYCRRRALTLPCVLSALSPYEKSRFVRPGICRTHRPSGWGPCTTWTLWCPPLTVMGHSVVTVVESRSQGLSFCYLAGIESCFLEKYCQGF